MFHLYPSIVEQSQWHIGTGIGQDVPPRRAFSIAEVSVPTRVAAGSLSQADGEGEPVLGARYGGCGDLDHDHLYRHWVEMCDLVLLCFYLDTTRPYERERGEEKAGRPSAAETANLAIGKMRDVAYSRSEKFIL